MRDFVQKTFVDKGMCADFAIHDTNTRKRGVGKASGEALQTRPKKRMVEESQWQMGLCECTAYGLEQQGESCCPAN